jgi:deazaflavin-dependent oxidoreductase (nitroreductase family)
MSEMVDYNKAIIDEFRANDGKVGGPFEGATVVLLHTTGAKSGQARVNPLAGLTEDDGTVYVFASAAGRPNNPDWYHNLVAHPEVEVEIGTESYTATAKALEGAARDAVYDRQKKLMPGFVEYEEKTKGIRTIPVIALTRS